MNNVSIRIKFIFLELRHPQYILTISAILSSNLFTLIVLDESYSRNTSCAPYIVVSIVVRTIYSRIHCRGHHIQSYPLSWAPYIVVSIVVGTIYSRIHCRAHHIQSYPLSCAPYIVVSIVVRTIYSRIHLGVVVDVIVQQLDLQLAMQLVPIATDVVGSNPTQCEVHNIM